MLNSRADRSALGAAPDVGAAVVDVCLKFLGPKTLPLNHTSKKRIYPSIISTQAYFDFARIITLIFATRPKCERRNRIVIMKYMSYTMVYVSIVAKMHGATNTCRTRIIKISHLKLKKNTSSTKIRIKRLLSFIPLSDLASRSPRVVRAW